MDESYFGGRRKGKRGRGAAGKVPVFGILQHGGKVYAQVIPDAKFYNLLPIIREKIIPDSIVYIPTIIAPTIPWMCRSLSTIVSTIVSSLRTSTITSMASKTLGIKPNAIYANTMGFPHITFR